jgi:predicted nucleic acid-binding Zn ribbon protein
MSDPTIRGARRSEHIAVFMRFRSVFGDGMRRRSVSTPGRSTSIDPADEPFAPGRDPRSLGRALGEVLRDRGWTGTVSQSELFAAWDELVGPVTAEHAEPVDLRAGVLRVRCDSTAWATQLGLMRSRILSAISDRFPDAGVESIRFTGPDAPSWKRGPRSVPGRGPRDTYG